ncbi:MBL fold metallo-hydrolase [Aerosakkonemataceae cyanobacterium BLCC-F154]|uniref:MBL fold metallo-hydrolase n=1 Tax=Floridaenema fluviatile BLCC-F154 TaxID=3153640 RepID=A0ABV4YBT0_9CYAN
MKRRKLLRYTGASLLTAFGTAWASGWQATQAQTGGSLSIRWLGHTCFLFTSGNQRVLVNPFRTIGCTAGYRLPKVEADLVLISSQLFDEGAVEGLPGNPKVLYEPGVYQFKGNQFQGIRTYHDTVGGRRFGTNVAWRWTQGGINILHLGGAAAPIELEQKILMGKPDLLLVPVGGGPKAYSPNQAMDAIKSLNPKLVIPTHYRTQAADDKSCDIVGVEEFLKLTDGSGMPIRNINSDSVTISVADLPSSGSTVKILSYQFSSVPVEPRSSS